MGKTATERSSTTSFLMEHALDVLLVCIPLAVILHYAHAPGSGFARRESRHPACLVMGKSTEALSEIGRGNRILPTRLRDAAGMILLSVPARRLTEVVQGRYRLDLGTFAWSGAEHLAAVEAQTKFKHQPAR